MKRGCVRTYARTLNDVMALCGGQSTPLGGERRPVPKESTLTAFSPFIFSVFQCFWTFLCAKTSRYLTPVQRLASPVCFCLSGRGFKLPSDGRIQSLDQLINSFEIITVYFYLAFSCSCYYFLSWMHEKSKQNSLRRLIFTDNSNFILN